MGRLVLAVYSALLGVVLVAGAPWWLLRVATSGRYRAGLAGRLGAVPRELQQGAGRGKSDPGFLDSAARRGARSFAQDKGSMGRAEGGGTKWVWVHAVSVGEVLAAKELVRGLEEAGYRVAVSTTTEAGQGLARERFAGSPVFYMPLDFGFLMRRYLRAIRPQLVVTMESELWPNLIRACRVAGVPLAVGNARVSDRSFPRYMRLRRFWAPLLREVTLFLAQSEETAERLRAMGVMPERVEVTGNLKYDVRVEEESELTGRVRRLTAGFRVIVAGSTLAGEEEMLLAAFAGASQEVAGVVLVIAPRHRDRFEEVFGLVEKAGFAVCRCSALPKQILPGTVLLLDTIGDLASMYSVAAVAFVGGSLVGKGGHNPLEPAQFGVPVVMGESVFNFREIAGAMRKAHAMRVVTPGELGGALSELLEESGGARAMGERGRAVFGSQAGASGRTVTALVELIAGRDA